MVTQTIMLDDNFFDKVKKFKPAAASQTDEQLLAEVIRIGYEALREQAEDEYLLALALEREKNDDGVRFNHEDIMRKYGITEEDLENTGDVELEYEI